MHKKTVRAPAKTSGFFDGIPEVFWLCLVFFLPLIFFPNLFTTFELAKVAVFKGATVLLILMLMTKYLSKGESPVFRITKYRFLWAALGIFLGCYVFSAVFSVAPALSFFGWYPRFQGLFTLFFYAVFGVAVFLILNRPEQRERLVLTLAAGLALVCAFALLQKFLPGFLQWWSDSDFNDRAYGTMANPNYLAGYIVMILPLLLANIFRKKHGLFSFFVLIVAFVTLFLTQSRAGLIAMAVSLLFFFFMEAYSRKAKKTLAVLVVLPLLLVASVWAIAANAGEPWVKNNALLQRLAFNDESLSSAETRLRMWPAVIQQISASPLIGFGPETFAVTFPSYAPETVNTSEDRGEIPDRAHNELLDFAVQIGIPGTLAYTVFILGIVIVAAKRFLERPDHDRVPLAMGSGILGLFTANMFGFSVTTHWVLLVLFAAVTLNTFFHKDFSTEKFRLRPLTKAAIFSVVAFCGIAMFWMQDVRKVIADTEMRRGYESAAFAEFAQTAAAYKEATDLAPTEAFYALNYANIQLQRLFEGERLSAAEIMDAYGAALHAARLRGYDGFSVSLAMEIRKWL